MTLNLLTSALKGNDIATVRELLTSNQAGPATERYSSVELIELLDEVVDNGEMFVLLLSQIPLPEASVLLDQGTGHPAHHNLDVALKRLVGNAAQFGQTDLLVTILTCRPELCVAPFLAQSLWKTTLTFNNELPSANPLTTRAASLAALVQMGACAPMGDSALMAALSGEPDQQALLPVLLTLADPLVVAATLRDEYRERVAKAANSYLTHLRLKALERLAVVLPSSALTALRSVCEDLPLPGLDHRLHAEARQAHLKNRPASPTRPRYRA